MTDARAQRIGGEIAAHYAEGIERGRLERGAGMLEYARTQALLQRILPPPPAEILDVGGGPGRYALWLTERGYRVRLIDPVALHVEQARAAARERGVELAGAEVDAISFADPVNGWATGFNNVVLHTTDGGATWTPQHVGAPPVTAITGVTAVDAATAWVAGWSGFVAVTRDGGETWRRERIAGAEGVDFEDAHFLGAQRGWVGGNIGIWKRRPQP